MDARLNFYENAVGAKFSKYINSGAPADPTSFHGYSVIRASSLGAAVGLAHGCPILHQGGGIEVAELVSNDDTFDQWLAQQSH